jgi:hypothetical protein
MTDQEAKVVAAWREASAELGVEFTSPFILDVGGNTRHEYLGLVHHFGARVGTLLSVAGEPSARTAQLSGGAYYSSTLGSAYESYDRQAFIDTLNDWQFFGPDASRPSWYSGASWS